MTRWDHARQMFGLGRRLRGSKPQPAYPADGPREDGSLAPNQLDTRVKRAKKPTHHARSVCIASGKGGTGKSSISASIATLFARRGTTLLMDGDLGCANAHILQNVHPKHSFADVIAGDVGIPDIVTPCANGVDLLAGGSGIARLAGLKSFELEMIGRGLGALEKNYEHLVVDAGAGLSRQTVAFAVACDATVVVTTPDVTAMTDAYAFIKVFVRQCEAQGIERPMPYIVVNRCSGPEELEHVAKRIQEVVYKFLGRRVECLGGLPNDRAVFRCAQRRTTVVEGESDSEFARAVQTLANSILSRISRVTSKGRRSREGVGERLAASAKAS